MVPTFLSPLFFTLIAIQTPGGAALPAGGAPSSSAGAAVLSGPATSTSGSGQIPASLCSPQWVATFGSATTGEVNALEVFDDGSGSGPALYAAGTLTMIGGVAVDRIAKWDGASWSQLGNGLSGEALTLTVHDDGTGSGPALYVGGFFVTAGGVTVNKVARWDGTSWSSLGSGLGMDVRALLSFDDGQGGGPALYASGISWPSHCIQRWDGTSWSPVGGGASGVGMSLSVFDDGSGPALFLGGADLHETGMSGGPEDVALMRWDGSTWSVAGILASYPHPGVLALTSLDDGTGPALYAGGSFQLAQPLMNATVAKWNGTSWSTLGSGPSGLVFALSGFDDGTGDGPALHCGGSFTSAGGASASRLAKWSGTAWSPLGSGASGPVRALTVWDDGPGHPRSLIAGGSFESSEAGDKAIAAWRGCGDEPGTAYCFGDGSGSACPCNNAGAPGKGCASSAGAGAVLGASGSASLAAGDLVFLGEGFPAHTPGTLFSGSVATNGGAGNPLGDGLRCASGTVLRLGAKFSDATGATTWAPDLAATGWTAGTTRHFQVWYRDVAGPCGNLFNGTNGYEVVLQP